MATQERKASLINDQKVRLSMKRLFEQSVAEIFGELFQNSNRANGKEVQIDLFANDGYFTYRDDGEGLMPGVDGFYSLLCLGESAYRDVKVAEQDPMGVGINALLSHDLVTLVEIVGPEFTIEIDTKKWWKNRSYYENWEKLLYRRTDEIGSYGFMLRVVFDRSSDFAEDLQQCLPCDDSTMSEDSFASAASDYPAMGYKGYMDIFLNGRAVSVDLPRVNYNRPKEIFQTEYLGASNSLTILHQDYPDYIIKKGGRDGSCPSYVRWHGQLIPVRVSGIGNYGFFLTVNEGQPLNPLSPSRKGVQRDAKFKALIKFVQKAIIAHWKASEEKPSVVELFDAIKLDSSARYKHFIARRFSPTPGGFFDRDESVEEEYEVHSFADGVKLLSRIITSSGLTFHVCGTSKLYGITTISEALGRGEKAPLGTDGISTPFRCEDSRLKLYDLYLDIRETHELPDVWADSFKRADACSKRAKYRIEKTSELSNWGLFDQPKGWKPVPGDIFLASEYNDDEIGAKGTPALVNWEFIAAADLSIWLGNAANGGRVGSSDSKEQYEDATRYLQKLLDESEAPVEAKERRRSLKSTLSVLEIELQYLGQADGVDSDATLKSVEKIPNRNAVKAIWTSGGDDEITSIVLL